MCACVHVCVHVFAMHQNKGEGGSGKSDVLRESSIYFFFGSTDFALVMKLQGTLRFAAHSLQAHTHTHTQHTRTTHTHTFTLQHAFAGFALVKKVPGTLHFAARSAGHSFDHTWLNMTHVVHAFYLGSRPTMKKYRKLVVSQLPDARTGNAGVHQRRQGA